MMTMNATNAKNYAILSDDDIRMRAPSVFADAPHHSRSARYGYIPTSAVLAGLRGAGFAPVYAAQQRVRDADRSAHCKHLLRLRPLFALEALKRAQVGDEFPELVLMNSHDGTSSYRIMAGWFRMICSNGAVVATSVVGDERIQHTAGVVDTVIEGSYRIINDAEKIADSRNAMAALELMPNERVAFARSAMIAKYGTDGNGAPKTSIPVDQALTARRREDQHNDLWTTFNVVQENLVRGGMQGRTARGRRVTSRAVNGIDGNVNLNTALWTLAEEMRRLKA